MQVSSTFQAAAPPGIAVLTTSSTAISRKKRFNMPSVFISYNHQDRIKANWLAKYLRKSGVSTWLAEADLKIGESLIERIGTAIESTDFVIALLSARSVKSPWVERELVIAMTHEIEGKRVVVLPVKIESCKLPPYLVGKLYADLTPSSDFRTELGRIATAVGVKPIQWPDPRRMYVGVDWQCILMVQTFADRREWGGPAYHCVRPKRRLKRILKVFGGRMHPIHEAEATNCIGNTIDNILSLDPDILGIGGKGGAANRLKTGLHARGFEGKLEYWGGDVGLDACELLLMYGVNANMW